MGGLSILTIIFVAVLVGAFGSLFVGDRGRVFFDVAVFLTLLLILVGVLPG